MANHKSSEKRIRQTKVKTLHNRYYAKTMRNAVRKLRATTDKDEAIKLFPAVQKMLDKLAKTNIITCFVFRSRLLNTSKGLTTILGSHCETIYPPLLQSHVTNLSFRRDMAYFMITT